MENSHDPTKGRDKILAFIFGVTFVAVTLAIAIFIPNPTGEQYTVFRIVIALAAAGIGAVLPGFIDVNFRGWLRAGGAVALFVIVYFFAPAAVSSGDEGIKLGPVPQVSAVDRAEEWLGLLDSGQYSQAYKAMATQFVARNNEGDFTGLLERYRTPMGPLKSRVFETSTDASNPPGVPSGHYRSLGFWSEFLNERQPVYEAITVRDQEGDWKVTSVYLLSRNDSGEMIPYSPDLVEPPPK